MFNPILLDRSLFPTQVVSVQPVEQFFISSNQRTLSHSFPLRLPQSLSQSKFVYVIGSLFSDGGEANKQDNLRFLEVNPPFLTHSQLIFFISQLNNCHRKDIRYENTERSKALEEPNGSLFYVSWLHQLNRRRSQKCSKTRRSTFSDRSLNSARKSNKRSSVLLARKGLETRSSRPWTLATSLSGRKRGFYDL